MKEIIYRPMNKNLKGEVKIKVPSMRAMYKIMLSKGFEPKPSEGWVSKNGSRVELLIALADLAEEHTTVVDIKRVDGSKSYSKFGDLEWDSDARELVTELSNLFLEGQTLGKNLSVSSKSK